MNKVYHFMAQRFTEQKVTVQDHFRSATDLFRDFRTIRYPDYHNFKKDRLLKSFVVFS